MVILFNDVSQELAVKAIRQDRVLEEEQRNTELLELMFRASHHCLI